MPDSSTAVSASPPGSSLNPSSLPRTRGSLWGVLGAIFGGTAVALGAFAAHGLDRVFVLQYAGQTRTMSGMVVPLAYKYLEDFKTGAEYQLAHALALFAVGIASSLWPSRWLTAAGWCFTIGVLLFSGSLYALTLLAIPAFGAVAPLGGLSLLMGWGCLAIGCWRRR